MNARSRTGILSLALGAAAVFGAFAAPQTAPAARADGEPTQPQLVSFRILSFNAITAQLEVVVPPELVGHPCQILRGPAPYQGFPVAMFPLQPGVNVVTVPAPLHACWYTAAGPFMPLTAEKSVHWDDNGDVP